MKGMTHTLLSSFQLGLLNPIRQGQTRYQFLIMQFDRHEELTAELNIKEYITAYRV